MNIECINVFETYQGNQQQLRSFSRNDIETLNKYRCEHCLNLSQFTKYLRDTYLTPNSIYSLVVYFDDGRVVLVQRERFNIQLTINF